MPARARVLALVASLPLTVAACSHSNGSGGAYRLWELRMPLAQSSPDGHSLRVVYQTLGHTPLHDVLVRRQPGVLGLTLRARLPTGPIIAVAWGFQCADIPLRQPLGQRRIVDDSNHRYPGSESGINDQAARRDARKLLASHHTCAPIARKRVKSP